MFSPLLFISSEIGKRSLITNHFSLLQQDIARAFSLKRSVYVEIIVSRPDSTDVQAGLRASGEFQRESHLHSGRSDGFAASALL